MNLMILRTTSHTQLTMPPVKIRASTEMSIKGAAHSNLHLILVKELNLVQLMENGTREHLASEGTNVKIRWKKLEFLATIRWKTQKVSMQPTKEVINLSQLANHIVLLQGTQPESSANASANEIPTVRLVKFASDTLDLTTTRTCAERRPSVELMPPFKAKIT